MAQYLLRDIIGKDLYAAKNLVGYYSFPLNPLAVVTIQKGDIIGNVLTAIPWGLNPIKYYYDLKTATGKKLFVEVKDGNFDLDKLTAQGVQNTTQKTQAANKAAKEEGEHWYDNLGTGIKQTVIILGSVALVVWGGTQYLKNRK